MNELVPVVPSAQLMMASDALKVWPHAQLPAAPGGRPRTIIVARQQASQLDVEALIACLTFLLDPLPILALCGGGASATFKAHPENYKGRFQVTDEEMETGIVDLRIQHRTKHFIANVDTNRNRAAINSIELLTQFEVPVDLLYVCARMESEKPFVKHCEGLGLRPVLVEQASAFAERSADRAYFPAVPRQLNEAFQMGEDPYLELLQQASPAVAASYLLSANAFCSDLLEKLNA